MSPEQRADQLYCSAMLPRVSRTFAVCIRLLSPQLEDQVRCAYLLCRIADTIEDTASLPLEQKELLLALFRRSLDQPATDFAALSAAFAQPTIADEELTRDAAITLRVFHGYAPAVQQAIRPWVQEMCDGMIEFARQQAQVRPGRLVALTSVAELDRYCYYVAGTVGHLLTELFFLGSRRVTRRHHARLKKLATNFGLGLQLTNIIKDVADDRRRGWSFVPRQLCQLAGITPEALGDPAHAAQAARVMAALIGKAKGHLNDALDYCCALPRSQYRMRLFCLTPLFFAVRTLARAERDPRLLDPGHKVKITRGEVYRTICMTYLIAPNNHLLRAYYRRLTRG